MTDGRLKKVLVGAGIAAGGAALAFLADAAEGGQFGSYSAFLGAVFAVGINLLRKYGQPPAPPS